MHLRLILSLFILLSGSLAAVAENVGDVPKGEIGDPQAALEFARSTCAVCHGIEEEQSLNPKAPRFKDVAIMPTTLIVWIQGTATYSCGITLRVEVRQATRKHSREYAAGRNADKPTPYDRAEDLRNFGRQVRAQYQRGALLRDT